MGEGYSHSQAQFLFRVWVQCQGGGLMLCDIVTSCFVGRSCWHGNQVCFDHVVGLLLLLSYIPSHALTHPLITHPHSSTHHTSSLITHSHLSHTLTHHTQTDGFTALYLAAQEDNASICQELLEAGADPLLVGGPQQLSPLHIASHRYCMCVVYCSLL